MRSTRGFSDIHYEDRDWEAYRNGEDKRVPKTRRPTTRDFEIYSMFPQTWGSTALGHGGVGGSAVSAAYTVVLHCVATREFLVYFGGTFCYSIRKDSKGLETFLEDCKNRCLASKKKSGKYYGS